MIDKPEIVQVAAQPIAVIPITVPRSEIRHVMGPGLRELLAAVAEQGLSPSGPWFTHHLRITPDKFEFEIGVAVATPITPAGRMKAGVRPAGTVARTVFHGGYEGLPTAWQEFDAWIAGEGHTREGDLWEYYVAGPESGSDPAAWRTELNRPLVA
jgi:effector-binding domain-containing protein